MRKIQFLILIILINSCSSFIDKNKLLTKNSWILSTIDNREGKNGRQYFKKTEKELVFKFFENGELEIIENSIPIRVNWKWDSTDKKKIIIDTGEYSGELNITTLDENHLYFWKLAKNSLNTISYDFLNTESTEWYDDEFVDGYRGAKQEFEATKLDTSLYEIIRTPYTPTVQNFEVLIKFNEFNQESIKKFIEKFRKEYCTNKCNISIYDSKEIIDLIDKKPLEGDDYIKVADHFIAMSTFDSPDYLWWYPFQDTLYKEYGGKNWKKEKIK